MGKKIVIIVLLVLILAAALVEYFYVEGAAYRLTEALQRVQSALGTGDSAASQAAARDFSAQWEKEKQHLEALFEHNEVDVISSTAKRIEAFCAEDDKTNALVEVSAGLFYIGHLREMVCVRWENIF